MTRPVRGSRPGASSRARTAAPALAGVTLLELLLVMAVLGVVLGAGVGMFASLDLGQRQVRGMVKNVLRSAQNSAIARQAPARVRLDREGGKLVAEASEVVGTWHFEGKTVQGAFGLDGTRFGGTWFVEDGYIGDAISFDGKEGSCVEVGVDHLPAFDFRHGFTLEVMARRETAGGGRVLVLGKSICVEITAAGSVRGWFLASVEDEVGEKQGGRVIAESVAGVADPDHWVRIELEYDRSALTLWVDGLLASRVPEQAAVWRTDGPLTFSDRRYAFPGSVDNVVIGTVVASEEVLLPETVRISEDSPSLVVFAPGGGLDRMRHPEPVLIHLDYDDGSRRSVLVGTYGTVDG